MNPRLNAGLNVSVTVLDAAAKEIRQAKALEGDTLTDRQELGAMRKSTAYIFAAAALERACKEALHAVIGEINAVALSPDMLRPSLFALKCASELDSISSSGPKSLARHKRAADMFEGMFSPVNGALGPVLPLDGKTPRQKHFDTIWRVFGFLPPVLPSPLCGLALEDLANGRNDVAHGAIDPISFGRTKPWGDVDQRVRRAEEVVMHLFQQADEYVTRRAYLR